MGTARVNCDCATEKENGAWSGASEQLAQFVYLKAERAGPSTSKDSPRLSMREYMQNIQATWPLDLRYLGHQHPRTNRYV